MLTDGSSEWSIVRLPACFFPSLAFSIFGCFFFFNDTATTEIYTLSLHDALPISPLGRGARGALVVQLLRRRGKRPAGAWPHDVGRRARVCGARPRDGARAGGGARVGGVPPRRACRGAHGQPRTRAGGPARRRASG